MKNNVLCGLQMINAIVLLATTLYNTLLNNEGLRNKVKRESRENCENNSPPRITNLFAHSRASDRGDDRKRE